MKKICLLGASGSIGLSTCNILETFQDKFELVAISINTKIDILEDILSKFKTIKYVCVCSKSTTLLKEKYNNITFFEKEDGLIRLIESSKCDMVVNALVGFVGLKPTVFALTNNIDVALANKETLVAGGELINSILAKKKNVHLYPIDSEHVALAKCLKNKNINDVKRLIITASGGPFRDLKREELLNVTLKDALNHPSWKMGAKITIDSATMVNKGFEIIEAYYLFNFKEEQIDVLLHDESVIHSLIEMNDHSYVADLGPADMRIPISFALFETNYQKNDNLPHLDLAKLGSLHFRELDLNRYPALKLARRCIIEKGTLGCAMNAANEAANSAFRNGILPFNKIETIIQKVMHTHKNILNPTLDDLIVVNKYCFDLALTYIKEETKCNL